MQEDFNKKIQSRNYWAEYGAENKYDKLKSWRRLKILKLSDLIASGTKNYFASLISQDSQDLQQDVADSLTATGIISVLILSITSSVLEAPVNINENTLFDNHKENFGYLAHVCGIISFIMASCGTIFAVLFYSNVIRVPTKCFPAYLQALGGPIFGLIWMFPVNSISFYLGSVVVRIILSSNLGMGIFTIVVAILLIIFTFVVVTLSDQLHALSVIITRTCEEEKKTCELKDSEVEHLN